MKEEVKETIAEEVVSGVAVEEVENPVEEVENKDNTSDEEPGIKTTKEVVKELVQRGCKMYKGLIVKNVRIKEQENYTMVTLVTKSLVEQFLVDEYGVATEGKSSNIITSNYAIASVIKEIDGAEWLGNYASDKPKILEMLLSGCSIDVVQERVEANQAYINPFSSTKRETILENNNYIYHVVGIRFGKTGKEFMENIKKALTEKMVNSLLD